VARIGAKQPGLGFFVGHQGGLRILADRVRNFITGAWGIRAISCRGTFCRSAA
jgi:hypothetical protein